MQKRSRDLEELLTINDTCDLLKISRPTVYRMIKKGVLKTVQVGGRMRFHPDELRRYINRRAA